MANFQLQDVQKVPYAVLETDADGNSVAPVAGDTCVGTSADTASFTIVPDATPDAAKAPAGSSPVQTGFIVGGSKNQAGVVLTFTISHADGSPAIIITDTLDNVTGPATNGSVSLGTPVAQ